MFPHGRISGSLRPFLGSRRSWAGETHPARQTTPSASYLTRFTRFLTCRRGAVALESALAALPLILALTGIFELVRTVFVGDLLKRASHRVAYANALEDSAASDMTALRTASLEAIKDEVGDWLSFELDGEGRCGLTPEEDDPVVDFCLKVDVVAYDNPSDMDSDTQSTAQLGGSAGAMVLVTITATPQYALSALQQRILGTDGSQQAVAIMRNERLETS